LSRVRIVSSACIGSQSQPEVAGSLIALPRVLGQTAGHDVLKRIRNLRIDLGEGREILVDDLVGDGGE
jgi:hypothetical protein